MKPTMIAAVLGLLLAATGWSFGLMPSATAQGGDYEVGLASTVILPGASEDVLLTVTPGASTPAAVGGEIVYDAALLTATGCAPLVGISDCNVDTPGVVLFQAADPSGWAAATDLISVTFENIGLDNGEATIGVTLEVGVDTAATPITADIVEGVVATVTHGDVNCDNAVNIVDALLIAQFGAGNRTGTTTCPLADPLTQILEPTIDVNCDNSASIVDALLIAQYSVSNRTAETTCPLSNPATTIYLGP